MTEPGMLILIDGPVASGKTTIVSRVAARARALGHQAASFDMDELVESVGGQEWALVTEAHRHQACELAATLVDRVLRQGAVLVAIAGSTVSRREWDELLHDLSSPADPLPADPLYVRLRVSTAEAVRRAQRDPTRRATRDPDVVIRLHDAIDWRQAREPNLEIITDTLTADHVTDMVVARAGIVDR